MKYIFILCVLHLDSAIGCCSVNSVREPEILPPLMPAREARGGASHAIHINIPNGCLLEVDDPWFEPEEWNGMECTKEEQPKARDNKYNSCNTDCDCVPCAPYCSR